ncbi:hypothetical protein GOBAR_AA01797 [Gossypium barbadense]|uniref:RNase H type-1 domain-containing protein n=1 Tax=Gossypium barbadense TaxID=3634 RepID=A0A2P5YT07_GOSBA|nr:hypothetical protein GOBAR_AA01797 [Gossypium barbadense]
MSLAVRTRRGDEQATITNSISKLLKEYVGSSLILHDWAASRVAYQRVLPRGGRQPAAVAGTWVRPPLGALKCNVDATCHEVDQRIGFGAVARDERERL